MVWALQVQCKLSSCDTFATAKGTTRHQGLGQVCEGLVGVLGLLLGKGVVSHKHHCPHCLAWLLQPLEEFLAI